MLVKGEETATFLHTSRDVEAWRHFRTHSGLSGNISKHLLRRLTTELLYDPATPSVGIETLKMLSSHRTLLEFTITSFMIVTKKK